MSVIETSWRECPRCGKPNYRVDVMPGFPWEPDSKCVTECRPGGCHWSTSGDRLADHWQPSNSPCDM
jgi:hypothetical protein